MSLWTSALRALLFIALFASQATNTNAQQPSSEASSDVLPPPPRSTVGVLGVEESARPPELPRLVRLRATEQTLRLMSMPSGDAFAMSIALREATEAKRSVHLVSSIIWGVIGGLMLTVGGALMALDGPGAALALMLGTGPAAWSLELLFDESPLNRLLVQWRKLRPIAQAVELERFERHLAAIAERERAHRTRTAVFGFVLAGLGATAMYGGFATDEAIALIPLGVLAFTFGLVMGFGSLGGGSTEAIFNQYMRRVFHDPTYVGS